MSNHMHSALFLYNMSWIYVLYLSLCAIYRVLYISKYCIKVTVSMSHEQVIVSISTKVPFESYCIYSYMPYTLRRLLYLFLWPTNRLLAISDNKCYTYNITLCIYLVLGFTWTSVLFYIIAIWFLSYVYLLCAIIIIVTGFTLFYSQSLFVFISLPYKFYRIY